MRAHPPEQGGLHLEADEKQHREDAEFGEEHDMAVPAADELEHVRADQSAGEQIAEDRAEPGTFGDRDRDDDRDQMDERLEKQGVRGRWALCNSCSRATMI